MSEPVSFGLPSFSSSRKLSLRSLPSFFAFGVNAADGNSDEVVDVDIMLGDVMSEPGDFNFSVLTLLMTASSDSVTESTLPFLADVCTIVDSSAVLSS